MESETELLTILFERKILTKKDDSIIYAYLPLEVLKGTEHNFDGTKVFVTAAKNVRSLKNIENENINQDEHTFEFNYINDICNINEKYVYGFSVMLGNQQPNEIKKQYDFMCEDLEEIKEHTIFHTVRSKEAWHKLFVTVDDLYVNIDPENYYELQDLMYGQLDDFSCDMRALIEENNDRIKTPSFVVSFDPNIVPLYSNEIYETVSKTVLCQDEQIQAIENICILLVK